MFSCCWTRLIVNYAISTKPLELETDVTSILTALDSCLLITSGHGDSMFDSSMQALCSEQHSHVTIMATPRGRHDYALTRSCESIMRRHLLQKLEKKNSHHFLFNHCKVWINWTEVLQSMQDESRWWWAQHRNILWMNTAFTSKDVTVNAIKQPGQFLGSETLQWAQYLLVFHCILGENTQEHVLEKCSSNDSDIWTMLQHSAERTHLVNLMESSIMVYTKMTGITAALVRL